MCQGPDHVFEQAVARRGGSENGGNHRRQGSDHENGGIFMVQKLDVDVVTQQRVEQTRKITDVR